MKEHAHSNNNKQQPDRFGYPDGGTIKPWLFMIILAGGFIAYWSLYFLAWLHHNNSNF